jgi:hypothetical protein
LGITLTAPAVRKDTFISGGKPVWKSSQRGSVADDKEEEAGSNRVAWKAKKGQRPEIISLKREEGTDVGSNRPETERRERWPKVTI